MKIVNSILASYQKQCVENEELKKKVDDIIKSKKRENWHYISRIKSPESYALKIETGRYQDLLEVDDFFACTLVVDNSQDIQQAKDIVAQTFQITNRRPPRDDYTFKEPDSFVFDDLRLYAHLRPDVTLPPESIFNQKPPLIFEIQIKTFLQHAWSIATHDLIYKGEDINWAKQRVAYQIKAILEHAEISIQEIEKIKDSEMIAKTNTTIKHLNEVRNFALRNWTQEQLPKDLTRLASNVSYLLNNLSITLEEIQVLLDKESQLGRGVCTLNLSPYLTILQTIINQQPDKVVSFMSSHQDSTKKVIIPPELERNSIQFIGHNVILL